MSYDTKYPFEETFNPLDMWEQMITFHVKYGIEPTNKPHQLPDDVARFRIAFLEEELSEFKLAIESGDLAEQIDGLVDLVVVAMGTAHLAGFDWPKHWQEVYEANMRKIRASNASDSRSKRKHSLDIVKPDGWGSPNHQAIINKAIDE